MDMTTNEGDQAFRQTLFRESTILFLASSRNSCESYSNKYSNPIMKIAEFTSII